MIPRGTTPTIYLNLNEDSPWVWSELSDGRVDIKVRCRVITRPLDECSIDGRTLSFKLAEDETMRWGDDDPVELQVCAVFPGGDIMKSLIVRTKAYRILNEAAM